MLIRKDGEFPLFDGQGSEWKVTNASQSVTGTLTGSAFGQTVATTGSSTSAYQYAATSGHRNDGDAGLMKVGARYYDAQAGWFVSRDTYLDQKQFIQGIAFTGSIVFGVIESGRSVRNYDFEHYAHLSAVTLDYSALFAVLVDDAQIENADFLAAVLAHWQADDLAILRQQGRRRLFCRSSRHQRPLWRHGPDCDGVRAVRLAAGAGGLQASGGRIESRD